MSLPTPQARLRVLWVTYEPPDSERGGGNIRQAQLLKHLADHVDVTLLTAAPMRDASVRAAVADTIEVSVPPATYRTKTGRRVGNLVAALVPRVTAETWVNRGARRAIGSALRAQTKPHDVVVVNHQALAALIRHKQGTAHWMTQMHHVSHERARQERAVAPGRRQRWLLEREERKSRALEHWAVQEYDAVGVVSDEDARLLTGADGELARGPVFIMPNGVDLDRLRPTPRGSDPVVLFTGSLQYTPNIDAAKWLAETIFPLVAAQVPGARLSLVGMQPAPELRTLAARLGFELHADVPSVQPYIEAARVAVVPLRAGTGTRLKALEYFAAGRPVVGTTLGLEGLGVVDGVHALVRDDAQSIADAIALLLQDDELAGSLTRAARALVEERFGWDRIGRDLAADLHRLVGG